MLYVIVLSQDDWLGTVCVVDAEAQQGVIAFNSGVLLFALGLAGDGEAADSVQ